MKKTLIDKQFDAVRFMRQQRDKLSEKLCVSGRKCGANKVVRFENEVQPSSIVDNVSNIDNLVL